MRSVAAALVALAALCGAACRPAKPGAAAAVPTPTPGADPAPATATAGAYGLLPAEKAAIDAFLASHADLRLSTDADARTPDAGLVRLYGVYHPYFVRGDVNDDGVLDLVVGFVRRTSPAGSPWFSVVVFAGRAGGGFDAGTFLERDISLADGDLSVDRDSIVITPDTNDDPNRRYRWDAVHRQFKFVSEDDEEPDSPAVTRTGFRVSGFESRLPGSRA